MGFKDFIKKAQGAAKNFEKNRLRSRQKKFKYQELRLEEKKLEAKLAAEEAKIARARRVQTRNAAPSAFSGQSYFSTSKQSNGVGFIGGGYTYGSPKPKVQPMPTKAKSTGKTITIKLE